MIIEIGKLKRHSFEVWKKTKNNITVIEIRIFKIVITISPKLNFRYRQKEHAMRHSEKAGLWECEGCGGVFERSQLVADETNEDLCPECFGRDDKTAVCRYYPDEIDIGCMKYHARNGG